MMSGVETSKVPCRWKKSKFESTEKNENYHTIIFSESHAQFVSNIKDNGMHNIVIIWAICRQANYAMKPLHTLLYTQLHSGLHEYNVRSPQ